MEDNALMMRCTKCGEMNRLPVVHCKRCGARLDFESAEKHMMDSSKPSARERAQTAGKLAVVAVLALMLGLILWPGKMTRTTGEAMDAKRYRMKCEILINAVNRGEPSSQVIAEGDINAHLRELLAAQPKATGGMSSSLKDIGARFFTGRAEVFVAIRRGPLTLTTQFYAKPEGSRMVVTGAKLGHLPLPGLVGRLFAGTQLGLFRQMKNESRILRNLDGASVNDGSIELLVKTGP